MSPRLRSDQRGATLFEILIVMGVVASLTILGMRMMSVQVKSQATADLAHEASSLHEDMVRTLSAKHSCGLSFEGQTLEVGRSAKAPVIKEPVWDAASRSQKIVNRFVVAQGPNAKVTYAGGRLKIESIEIDDFMPDFKTNTANDRESRTGRAVLRVTFSKVQGKDKVYGANAKGGKLLTHESTVRVRVASRDPLKAGDYNRITECFALPDSQGPSRLNYPSDCALTLGHQDDKGQEAEEPLQLNGPGYVGLELSGNVNRDDKFWIRGKCQPDKSGKLSAYSQYFEKCSIALGQRDWFSESAPTIVTQGTRQRALYRGKWYDTYAEAYRVYFNEYLMWNGSEQPEIPVKARLNSDTPVKLQTIGDVDGNDYFYFSMYCPKAGPEEIVYEQYLKDSCYLCMGWSDESKSQPLVRACSPILTSLSSDVPRWTRFRFSGDVDENDILYLGFFCGENHGEVREIQYR